ncbi:hypothetical protein RJ641_025777 [Dillenia turbinata]|uniref:Uncharacterized protein n=1 Tax=Dillenia turbinata TaxID=194707 RepID=A0AAN8W288_9MAGN
MGTRELFPLLRRMNFYLALEKLVSSPAIVIAYLMKCKEWRLTQSYQWVKEWKPYVELSQTAYQQLKEYEQKIVGSNENLNLALPVFPSLAAPSFSLAFQKSRIQFQPLLSTALLLPPYLHGPT